MNNEQDFSRGKFQRTALEVGEAQSRIMAFAHPLETETVPLGESLGRILAEPARTAHPFPAFNRSSMDGYAIIADDTTALGANDILWLEVIEEIPCGTVAQKRVESGTAARIMTGAQLPEGADAVVMLEATEGKIADGQRFIGLRKPVSVGQNITPRGLELQQDEEVLPAGRLIGAGEIAVLAALGKARVQVRRRPKVAIFATGSELLDVDEPLQPGKIRNSNSPMLEALVRQAGGEPVLLGAVADDLELARSKVQMALEHYDLVVTTGGVSVGDYDIMGDLVRERSGEMLFNKVAMRPGSVTTAAVRAGKLLFALSGNPGACFVGFQLFVRPAMGKMLGATQPFLPQWMAVLGEDYTKTNNFTRFMRARLEFHHGMLHAYPAGVDESSVTVTIKDSDCLIIVPSETVKLDAGARVDILKLPGEFY
ncbi:gephyrin-like molybdotransferase Glp [Paenibacillus sp. NFR01]|uniref:molybdopterin molybdotransferase MoeA n=1 Tax=Paenibacillus sp. NFR01 TaxID=1566279 RepID=UPI0008B338C4|nr:gephyrin-like molybdotransferase Glp [Paenibacillus sp. NFR01]SET31096.1 molybdopterin molybdotransferase [Paenibacillus sp. NFR01]